MASWNDSDDELPRGHLKSRPEEEGFPVSPIKPKSTTFKIELEFSLALGGLPVPGKRVLVQTDLGSWFIGFYDGEPYTEGEMGKDGKMINLKNRSGRWWKFENEEPDLFNVAAWAYLPEGRVP